MSPDTSSPLPAGARVVLAGGTTGVGRAAACALVRRGCRVFICGRDPECLREALAAAADGPGAVGGVTADLSTSDGVLTFFAAADEWLGGLDAAVLNAGIGCKGELATLTHGECLSVLATNLTSYVLCSLEAMKRLAGRGGHIVMTGSLSADIFEDRSSVYVATKAGIRGFALSLRKEANAAGVRVSVIEPGSIGSDMVDESPERQREMTREHRMLQAEDVARAILFTLDQPPWCDVIRLQLKPRLQLI